MRTRVTVLLLAMSGILTTTIPVRALETASECFYKHTDAEHPASTKWYGCSSCGKIVESGAFPDTEVGKCPKRANLVGVGHAWDALGESGGTTYKCNYCAASVSTKNSPSASKCPKSPTKNVGGAWGHQWQKVGDGKSGQGSVNRF